MQTPARPEIGWTGVYGSQADLSRRDHVYVMIFY